MMNFLDCWISVAADAVLPGTGRRARLTASESSSPAAASGLGIYRDSLDGDAKGDFLSLLDAAILESPFWAKA